MESLAIILAGGNGVRFGSKKQFLLLDNIPLYKIVYDKVASILPKDRIVVVGVDIDGGNSRSLSVKNGLEYFQNSKQAQNVIILEAARPLVTKEQITQLLSCYESSISFVMPLVNTVIKRDGTYQNREDFFDLLTPQCFDYNKLLDAYNKINHYDYTDETRIMWEVHGIKPTFIEGGENLIKVTYKKDIAVIEQMYKTIGI